MKQRIAVLGSSCNPPGLHHRHIAIDLLKSGFKVIVVPSGFRPDKKTVNDIEPLHRAIMTDMTFGDLEGVEIYLDDLERDEFTRTYEFQRLFRDRGDLWNYVGTDLLSRNGQGMSTIVRDWFRGDELWKNAQFIVGTRPGYDITPNDLPPRHELMQLTYGESSTNIRSRVFNREPFADLVVPAVRDYIERYGLYRGRMPSYVTPFSLNVPKPFVVFDDHNEDARKIAFGIPTANLRDANCIIVVGGDGTMLHAIQLHWRRRLPFFGINAGHLGFLLNNVSGRFTPDLFENLVMYHLPLLYARVTDAQLQTNGFYALNDAWLERSSKQTAWIRVVIDGRMKIRKLVSDGVLVATAAGSTAYASAMGATPLLLGTPQMLLVGNNVMLPRRWKVEPLEFSSKVVLRSLDPVKRPVRACIDSDTVENAIELSVRTSRIASVALLQFSHFDMVKKRSVLLMR